MSDTIPRVIWADDKMRMVVTGRHTALLEEIKYGAKNQDREIINVAVEFLGKDSLGEPIWKRLEYHYAEPYMWLLFAHLLEEWEKTQ